MLEPSDDDTPFTLSRCGLLQLFAAATTALCIASKPLLADASEPELLGDSASTVVSTDARRLELFLISRGIRLAHLARESGYSRMYLLRVRMGRVEPSREFVVHITRACRRLARESVMPGDLFALSPRDAHAVARLYARIDREERSMYES